MCVVCVVCVCGVCVCDVHMVCVCVCVHMVCATLSTRQDLYCMLVYIQLLKYTYICGVFIVPLCLHICVRMCVCVCVFTRACVSLCVCFLITYMFWGGMFISCVHKQ